MHYFLKAYYTTLITDIEMIEDGISSHIFDVDDADELKEMLSGVDDTLFNEFGETFLFQTSIVGKRRIKLQVYPFNPTSASEKQYNLTRQDYYN